MLLFGNQVSITFCQQWQSIVNYVQLPSVNNGNQLSITAVVIDPWQNSLELCEYVI